MHPHLRTAAAVALLALTVAACGGSTPTASPSAPPRLRHPPSRRTPRRPPRPPRPRPRHPPRPMPPPGPDPPPRPPPPRPRAAGPHGPAPHARRDGRAQGQPRRRCRAHRGRPGGEQGPGGLPDEDRPRAEGPPLRLRVAESKTAIAFSLGAYRFVGADPAKLKTEFVQAILDSQPGSTAKDETIGGRKVVTLGAPSGDQGPPIHLLFDGDTVFVVSSPDADFAAEAVKALPVQ